ncbi:glutathione S-transferase [Roseibacterium sp. SDUM158017]|uniref:glutathione S-transferase n=1 Tax=Roseicyclus salinarum TaxID=3036773 RepID=UPI002414D48E|nr:glutathione S-transferase [Roseibacterium sp. SDUM158017]MDG4647225.1 glutathione S-transferase [Roseibacterium sp. SDUM158017]
MTYRLLIGQRSYSSWSLRGWLPFAAFGIPVEVVTTRLYSDAFASDVAAFGGKGTVPVARTPEGGILDDSLAIAWHLAEAFPDHGLLPADGRARAEAQSIVAEMHSGFTALRRACPMNLRTGWAGFAPSQDVLADLGRIADLWGRALDRSGGPWLFGGFTLADVFHGPVATRIATYGLPGPDHARRYVDAMLAHPDIRRWRAMGAAEGGADLSQYRMPLERVPFPAPPTIAARAVDDGTPLNDACPYSGEPVTHLAEIGGDVFGFCNRFCRDKTVADPEAWPRFTALREGRLNRS